VELPYRKQPIQVLPVITSLYAAQDLQCRIRAELESNSVRSWHLRERFAWLGHEIQQWLDQVTPPLARAFFDYTALVCAGEARWAVQRCAYCWDEWVDGEHGRSDAWDDAVQYNPYDLLSESQKLFEMYWRGNGYGGKKWAQIAKVGQLYKKVPDSVFIDLCVDLSHNSGVYLDKGIIFYFSDPSHYRVILDLKFAGQLLDTFTNYYWNSGYFHELYVLPEVYEFLREAKKLHLFPKSFSKIFVWTYTYSYAWSFDELLINWRFAPFKPHVIDSLEWEGEESDEENDDGCDEDTEEDDEEYDPVPYYWTPAARLAA
jgi:hypothetical protein